MNLNPYELNKKAKWINVIRDKDEIKRILVQLQTAAQLGIYKVEIRRDTNVVHKYFKKMGFKVSTPDGFCVVHRKYYVSFEHIKNKVSK